MKQNLFDYITRMQPTPVELSKTPPTVRNYIKLLEKAILTCFIEPCENENNS